MRVAAEVPVVGGRMHAHAKPRLILRPFLARQTWS